MRRRLPLLVLALAAVEGWTAGELSEGALLARACSGCHSASSQKFPSLEAWSAPALADALLAYRGDHIRGTLMNRIAKGYSERDIHAIAEYLGTP